MKNKQINKFLLMFFLSFTLFFSVSYAEFSMTPISSISEVVGGKETASMNFGDYTVSQILNIANNHYYNPDNSDYKNIFDNMSDNISANDYDYLFYGRTQSTDGESYIGFAFFKKDAIDFGFYHDGSTLKALALVDTDISADAYGYFYTGSTYSRYFTNQTKGKLMYRDVKNISSFSILKSSFNVKKIDYNGGYYWDGISYYKSIEEPNEPQGPTADTIANIHNILMNSSDLSKRFSDNKRYFIVYTETSDSYDVYFYPDVDLVARYFSVDENYKFDSYSNSKTSYIELSQKDMWHSFNSATWYENLATILNPSSYWKYQLFRKYPHQTSFSYKWEVDGCNVWETPGGLTLDLSVSKIVYTSHDIGNMIVEQNGEEYVGSIVEDNSIIKPTLINPETGEEYILSEVPESSVEDVGFWESLINTVLDKIFNLADVLLTVFGANVVTLIFAIAIKTITVLVSSIALIFRFISFILTLVVIPASSALLAVDVATNTTGLAFTGLNWGTHFINGLNFIKTIQWNGLGLWTLFEVFVASLEVVLFVKIVRKHYRTL